MYTYNVGDLLKYFWRLDFTSFLLPNRSQKDHSKLLPRFAARFAQGMNLNHAKKSVH
jgi:hypothetical protein